MPISQTENPDASPDSGDPTGPCPWCGRVSSFTERSSTGLNPDTLNTNSKQRVSVLSCQGCKKGVLVVDDLYHGETRYEGSGTPVRYRGFHWWPTPGDAELQTLKSRGLWWRVEGQSRLAEESVDGAVPALDGSEPGADYGLELVEGGGGVVAQAAFHR